MDVGNQIRERRQALGISQEELAQRLYVSRVSVSHWETGLTAPVTRASPARIGGMTDLSSLTAT